MTDNDTALAPKLALQIVIAVGASAQIITHAVKNIDEAQQLMVKISKTPGMIFLAEGSFNPVMFRGSLVALTQIVRLGDPVAPPKLARIN